MIAREIQKGLLPSVLPTITRRRDGSDEYLFETGGGDYYDVLRVDDRRWVIAIGDVSGKGRRPRC